jgi:hypothetical protein
VTPEVQLAAENTYTVSWTGEPGQVFRFQMARDPAFVSLLEEAILNEPQITRPKPEPPGTYYVRTQATDPDGFVGPYSATQRFDIPLRPPPPERSHPWWLLLMVLLPLAL